MLNIVGQIEKLIIRALVILLLLAMVLGTIELARITVLEVFAPPFLLLDISKIFEGFGLALIILIGLELLKVLKLFLVEDKVKPEIIVEIAVIALCNKIITLDAKHTSGDVLLGIAAILTALSIGYFVFRFRASNKETYQNLPVAEKSSGEN
ncbi:MAG: phosphate-starvation-inducible PsiE family protein [Acidobacteria bacterium]|nr:phosphate-starvation-inducible PsiE family protein [Acidobacteriota bacterium]